MQKKRISTKHLIITILVLILMLALAFTIFAFFVRKDIGFIIKADIRAVFAESSLEQTTITNTVSVPLDALLADERIIQDQSLMLINEEYCLSDNFQPEVGAYRETDVQMNVCMHDAYAELSANIEKLYDQKLFIRSAFRTVEEQLEAISENEKGSAQLGASEHQAGLALDVYVPYFAGAAFLKTDVGRYVNEKCGDFGFIIRYPSYGQSSTKISYEPWHLRYVGFPHGEIMMNSCMTLEEYLSDMEPNAFYCYANYLITRQTGPDFCIPSEFHSAVISEDNTGMYILTFDLGAQS